MLARMDRWFTSMCAHRGVCRWVLTLAIVMVGTPGGCFSLPSKYSDEIFNQFSGSDGLIDLTELRQLILAINGSLSVGAHRQCTVGGCVQQHGCDFIGSIYDAKETSAGYWKVNRTGFEVSCPSLLYLMTLNCSLNSSHVETVADSEHAGAPSQLEVWGYGFLFMMLINSTTLAGVVLLPLRSKASYGVVLVFLVALAMGCLVGNGVFVLVPEAFEIVNQDHYLLKSFAIISGIYIFYVMEHVMELLANRGCCRRGGSGRGSVVVEAVDAADVANGAIKDAVPGGQSSHALHYHHHHSVHHHQHSLLQPELGLELQSKAGQPSEDSTTLLIDGAVNGGDSVPVGKPLLMTQASANNLQMLQQDASIVMPATKPITRVAYMVLIGHGFHNFIDGMSIGAAFASNKLLGISLSLAVICEEIPHGLGDFAILLSAGMSKRRAVLYNFLSGCPCYVGLVVGIKLAEVMHAAPWILGIAGGIFIYIGLADMLPEMKAAEESSSEPIKTFFIQNAGIICGAAAIAAMAHFGKAIQL